MTSENPPAGNAPPPPPAGPGAKAKILGRAVWFLLVLVCGGCVLWGTLAIYWSNLPAPLRPLVAAAYGLGSLVLLILVRPRARKLIATGILFGVVLLCWWFGIPPSNARDWQPDVAILPYAEIQDNHVTLHNIRNCDYRSETNYDVRHYDKELDLDQLRTVDLYTVYWGSPMICHTMLSFGFGPGDFVCISIETRKERGESYSAIKGFFRQYELTYIVADERDVVRLRTNYRGEQTYLYRLNTRPEVARKVFLDYLRSVNSLRAHPEWYNALTSNCTSNIRGHTSPYARSSPWSWKLIVNGYLDEMAYANGALFQGLPLAELKRQSLVNERGRAADKDPEFSRRIREGLPGMNL